MTDDEFVFVTDQLTHAGRTVHVLDRLRAHGVYGTAIRGEILVSLKGLERLLDLADTANQEKGPS